MNWIDPWGLSASDGQKKAVFPIKQENIYTVFDSDQGYFGDNNNGAKALFGSLKIDTRPSTGNFNINIETGVVRVHGEKEFLTSSKRFGVVIRGSAKSFSADGFAGLKDGALGTEGNMSMLTFDSGIGGRAFGYQLDINLKLFVGGVAGGGSAGLNNSLLPRGSISFGVGLGGSLDMSINKVKQ